MPKYDPFKHHRRSIRLQGYDYTQAGAYFVTICVEHRECLFGGIVDGNIHLNECGQIVQAHWENIPNHFPNVELDAFVIMPNHLHGIIVITDTVGAKHFSPAVRAKNASPLQPRTPHGTQSRSLGAIVQNFKSVSTRKINQARDTQGAAVWQRNYHEHIIRNERELNAIREYIANNPANWSSDTENPNVPRRKT